MTDTVIYPARRVRTMDRGRPTAAGVAVRGHRILAVGTMEELRRYPDVTVDDRFADHVILPGFVEAHTHTFGAQLWAFPYVGYFDRTDPQGGGGTAAIRSRRSSTGSPRSSPPWTIRPDRCWPGASTPSTSPAPA